MFLSFNSYACHLFSIRVPSLCDFTPLNHHVEALHQLVQAAQSVDEMSQTITDLLSELKVQALLFIQVPLLVSYIFFAML